MHPCTGGNRIAACYIDSEAPTHVKWNFEREADGIVREGPSIAPDRSVLTLQGILRARRAVVSSRTRSSVKALPDIVVQEVRRVHEITAQNKVR